MADASQAGGAVTKDEAKTAALDYVNDIRRWRSQDTLDELPRGDMKSAQHCPIAHATGGECDGSVLLFVDTDIETYVLPDPVQTFTELFDNGHYPELTYA